jgi:hypothetical protein
MSLLLLFGGTADLLITPIATDNILSVLTPDEVATGVPIRIWCEWVSNTGADSLDSVPQIRVFGLADDGSRIGEVGLHYMTSAGEGYYYDWTPSSVGHFLVTVAGLASGVAVFASAQVTARPKFDPVALALSDVLVSRM